MRRNRDSPDRVKNGTLDLAAADAIAVALKPFKSKVTGESSGRLI
jgi:hypothetical protein